MAYENNHNQAPSPKPKILVFSMGFDPFIGGAEIAITELTKRLSPHYEFHIITCRIRRELPRFEDKGYIKIYRVGLSRPGADNTEFAAWPLKLNKYLFPFLAYTKGIELQWRHRFQGHWCMLAFTGAIGSLLFKLTFPQIKYVLELQDGRSYEERKALFGPLVFPLIRASFQKADAIKTIANFQIEVARRSGATAPATRIPNGVDVSIFTKPIPPADTLALRQQLGIQTDEVILISTTRLVARRGHEALITSLTHLPAHYRLLLCGSGPHEATLRDLATKNGVLKRIIFAGDVSYSDIPKYLAVAQIFVRPSIYEGMGNSFIEAMAARIPVVGTPVGGIVDFLFDDEKNIHPAGLKTGYVANVDDPADLATQIKSVIENSDESTQRVAAAAELAVREYDWDVIAVRTKTEIWELLFKRP